MVVTVLEDAPISWDTGSRKNTGDVEKMDSETASQKAIHGSCVLFSEI